VLAKQANPVPRACLSAARARFINENIGFSNAQENGQPPELRSVKMARL
jgi:hypothetical protein